MDASTGLGATEQRLVHIVGIDLGEAALQDASKTPSRPKT
jgi:hypothetical protein